VINDPDGTYVFLAVPAETEGEAIVTRRPVVVGELSQFGIEVSDGLSPGDFVITAGISVIREGQRVLVLANGQ
jgi:multidrug efflux pump subunit AcrA (membrane-fusion protein)